MCVGGVGEHAGGGGQNRAVAVWKVSLHKAAQQGLVFGVETPIHVGGVVDKLFQMMKAANLESGDAVGRHAVKMPLLDVQDENRKHVHLKGAGHARLHPDEHLPLRLQHAVVARQESMRPGAGRQHQSLRLIDAAIGSHPHAGVAGLPIRNRLVAMHLGAALEGCRHVRHDAPLGRQQPGLRFVQRHQRRLHPVAGKSPPHRRGIQNFVCQVVRLGRFQRPGEHLARFAADIQGAGDVQKTLLDGPLQRPPQFVGAVQERHVGRVLVIRQADDPRDAVRGAQLVRNIVLLKAQNPLAPFRQVIHRRAAHPPDTDYDRVVRLHGTPLSRVASRRGVPVNQQDALGERGVGFRHVDFRFPQRPVRHRQLRHPP